VITLFGDGDRKTSGNVNDQPVISSSVQSLHFGVAVFVLYQRSGCPG
jgi:hypothetical protein